MDFKFIYRLLFDIAVNLCENKFLIFVYLKGRVSYTSSIYWFGAQMIAKAEVGQAQCRRQELLSGLSCVAGRNSAVGCF